MSTPTVYRHFDRHGVLLYVGLSVTPLLRQGAHASSSRWWGEVSQITLEKFSTKEQMIAAEIAAITVEKPIHNVLNAVNEDGSPRLKRNCSKTHYVKTKRQKEIEVFLKKLLGGGMTVRKIADQVGLSYQTIRNIAEGRVVGNASTVDKLAAYFKRQQRKDKV